MSTQYIFLTFPGSFHMEECWVSLASIWILNNVCNKLACWAHELDCSRILPAAAGRLPCTPAATGARGVFHILPGTLDVAW